MKTTIDTVITFGRGGNSSNFQTFGWYESEDRHTCSAGPRSSLCLNAPTAPFGYFLEIDWQPILNPPFLCSQTVTIEVNGNNLPPYQVTRAGMVAFRCPPPKPSETKLQITFHHPVTVKPSDLGRSHDNRELSLFFRRLRLLPLAEPWRPAPANTSGITIKALELPAMIAAAESATQMSLSKLLTSFEMLAGNCDMGLALRALNYENLSLLRFAGANPAVADKGLETGFAGLGDQIDATIADNPIKEWMVSDASGLRFHTGQSSAIVSKDEVLKKFKPYAKMLTRKLMQDLDIGEKVFIYSDHKNYNSPRTIESALPIFLSLRRRSKSNMLWVCPSGSETPTNGSVSEILPGLACAALDILAPPLLIGGGITVSGWLTILCNAARVFNLAKLQSPSASKA